MSVCMFQAYIEYFFMGEAIVFEYWIFHDQSLNAFNFFFFHTHTHTHTHTHIITVFKGYSIYTVFDIRDRAYILLVLSIYHLSHFK